MCPRRNRPLLRQEQDRGLVRAQSTPGLAASALISPAADHSNPTLAQSRDKYLTLQSKSFAKSRLPPAPLVSFSSAEVNQSIGAELYQHHFFPAPVNQLPAAMSPADITLITRRKIPLNLEKFRPLVPAEIMMLSSSKLETKLQVLQSGTSNNSITDFK